jgi:2-polyprenyl-6-methoxyphenol hydroxylase-like FAD-dependent oxidoreductase
MSKIIILGSGICGLAAAILLAQDGHDVTVLERDDQPLPASCDEVWQAWERRGVAQFRQAHFLQPGGRHTLDSELPAVKEALLAAGCMHYTPLSTLPPFITDRAPRPGDECFWTVTGRRPVIEYVVAGIAAKQVDIRRGITVVGLVTGPAAVPNIPHVTGVKTASSDRLEADLIVDAMGRRSMLSGWLDAIGTRAVHEEAEDCGFTYYTRYFRSQGNGVPQPRVGLLTPMGSFSLLTLPGDNQTWSVTVYISSHDQALKGLRHADKWTKLIAACPLHAHWLDGKPITDVLAMSGVIDRYRRFVVDGTPVATGVAAVGDAWACTNPSLGRGMTHGLFHVTRLRDIVRSYLAAPGELAQAWDAVTETEMTPWYRATVEVDRARRAEIDALIEGRPVPVPADPVAMIRQAMAVAMAYDAEVFRAYLEIIGVLALPQQVLARPGMTDRIMTVAEGRDPLPVPGPTREEVLDLMA